MSGGGDRGGGRTPGEQVQEHTAGLRPLFPNRLVNGREVGQCCEGMIINPDNGHILRDPHARTPQCSHCTEGDLVGVGKNCRRWTGKAQQLRHRIRSRLTAPRNGKNHFLINRNAGFFERSVIPLRSPHADVPLGAVGINSFNHGYAPVPQQE